MRFLVFAALALLAGCAGIPTDMCGTDRWSAPETKIENCGRVIAAGAPPSEASRIYTARGYAWQEKNEPDRAIADFDAALRLDPRNAPALASRAAAWLKKGDAGRALADADAAVGADPKFAAGHSSRADALLARGDHDGAARDYSEAIRLYMTGGGALEPYLGYATYLYLHRARAYLAGGRKDLARADYIEAFRITPGFFMMSSQDDLKGMLDSGVDPDMAMDQRGSTMLHAAAHSGSMGRLRLLLQRGADPNARTKDGMTPLMGAMTHDVARELIAKGARADARNEKGNTALMWAAAQGNLEFVKLLVANGADVNAATTRGVTALGILTHNRPRPQDQEIIDFLRAHGAR